MDRIVPVEFSASIPSPGDAEDAFWEQALRVWIYTLTYLPSGAD